MQITIAYKPVRNLILFAISSFIFIYLFQKWSDYTYKRVKESYVQFDNSEIKGILENTFIEYHMTAFKLKDSNKEYIINPNIDRQGNIFDTFAKPGDSIIKPLHGKILILKGRIKNYEFTFENLLKD